MSTIFVRKTSIVGVQRGFKCGSGSFDKEESLRINIGKSKEFLIWNLLMVNGLLLLKLVLAVSGERARCNFITCTVLRTRSIIHLTVHGASDGAPDSSLIHLTMPGVSSRFICFWIIHISKFSGGASCVEMTWNLSVKFITWSTRWTWSKILGILKLRQTLQIQMCILSTPFAVYRANFT